MMKTCPHCGELVELKQDEGYTSWVCPECKGFIPGTHRG